jgi:hypothetical protein
MMAGFSVFINYCKKLFINRKRLALKSDSIAFSGGHGKLTYFMHCISIGLHLRQASLFPNGLH